MTRGIITIGDFVYDLFFSGHRLSQRFIRLVFPKLTSVKERTFKMDEHSQQSCFKQNHPSLQIRSDQRNLLQKSVT